MGAWLAAAAVAFAFAAPPADAAPTSMPKLVLVTVDGLDAAVLETGALPALERVGARGRRYPEARAASPLAFPALVSLLTGRTPSATGVADEATRGLGAAGRTLAEALAANGFRGLALPADPIAHSRSGIGRGFAGFLAASPALPDSARVDSALAWLGAPGKRFAWLGLSLGAPADGWRRADGIGPGDAPALSERLRALDASLARLERGLERAILGEVAIVAIAGTGASAATTRRGGDGCAAPLAIAGPGVGSRLAALSTEGGPVSLLRLAPTLAALAGASTGGFGAAPLTAPARAATPGAAIPDCAGDPRADAAGVALAGDACRAAWDAAAEARRGAPDSVGLGLLETAAERCPQHARAAVEYAAALSRANREPDAARAFLALLEAHPGVPEARLAYADHLLRFRRFEMVAAALAPIAADSPLAALAAWRGALARIGALQLVAAEEEVARAAALASPTAEALEVPARLRHLRDTRRAADFEPRSLAARLAYARALGDLALHEQAYQELHVARGIDTTSAEPDYWMGTLLMAQGRARHAAPTFERGLARDPGHRPSRIALADALLLLERRADARRELEAALALDPADPRAQYNLACLLALDGETAAALEALRRAVAHGYADWERLATDPDLDAVRPDPGYRALLDRRPR